MKRIIRGALTVCFFILLPVHNSAINGQAPSSDKELAKFLLDRILDTRIMVNNFRCTVSYHDYRPKEVRQRLIDQAVKAGMPKKQVEMLINRQKQHNEYRYDRQQIAFDNQGRARFQRVSWISDADGNLIKETSNRISTWDGENAIEFSKHPENIIPSAILSNEQPFETTKRIRQPWQQFGGDFCPRFAGAIDTGAKINVKKEQYGTYRVEIIYENDKKEVAIVDPSQGYSLTSQESYVRGQLRYRCKANFTEVSPGVWFPTEGEDNRFTLDDPPLLRLKSTMKVTGVTINDPNFYEGLFRIDFPKGTSVVDATTGLKYTVGKPMSEKMYGISDAQSLDEVAMDTLEEMAKKTDQNHQDVELFVPKVGIALKRGEPFIVDLSDGKLINPQNKPESQESDKFLTKLGKGDIAWDGTVVTTRGSKVLTIQQESKRPLRFTNGKWTGSYKLPEKVELPYSMLVVTHEDVNYLMNILKIKSGGITVSYRELNPDELSRYKQESEDS